MVDELIQELRNRVNGELSDRNRVVDALLDLRLALADRPHLVGEVDRHLRELPGLTIVPNAWWLGVLETLERQATRPLADQR